MKIEVNPMAATDTELMSVLAHDLRSPLTAIRGAATLLLQSHRELDPERISTLLGIIESQSGRLADKVDDILIASRIEGGRLQVSEEDTDLGGVIAGVLDAARRAAPGRRLRAAGVVDGVHVHADSERVGQILRILLDNAVRHSPDGSWIDIRVDPAPASVRVEVRDRGTGVAVADRRRIFDRFTRLEGSGPGIGLGLFVVRGVVTAMGGDCGVESRPGGGSVFWFQLPGTHEK